MEHLRGVRAVTPADAWVYAQRLAVALGKRCWSVAREDLAAAAFEGYLKARARFTPPGDFGKYARSYMRGAAKEVIRQEAKAHGLTRPHTKRCPDPTCRAFREQTMATQYCTACLERMRVYDRRRRRAVKARRRAYDQRSYVKARRRAYDQRSYVKARRRAYDQRSYVKARHRAYEQRPDVKARRRERDRARRQSFSLRRAA